MSAPAAAHPLQTEERLHATGDAEMNQTTVATRAKPGTTYLAYGSGTVELDLALQPRNGSLEVNRALLGSAVTRFGRRRARPRQLGAQLLPAGRWRPALRRMRRRFLGLPLGKWIPAR